MAQLHAATGELNALAGHANPCAPDPSLGDELWDDEVRGAHRDGKTDPLSAADDRRVDPDDLAARVDERATGVAGIERGVRLDHGVDDAPTLRPHGAAERTHDPRRDGGR